MDQILQINDGRAKVSARTGEKGSILILEDLIVRKDDEKRVIKKAYFSLVADNRTDVLYNRVKYFTWSRFMSELKDVITAYRKLPFGDRVVFYSTVSNDVDVREETVQDFLIETRMGESLSCLYCKGDHVVRNGKRKDGTQRFLCRDCGKSFHRTLKEFIGKFHGVSTKHLGNYIVWNNLIANNRRKSEETLGQLFARMLSAGISVRNKDISSRSPLPSLEV